MVSARIKLTRLLDDGFYPAELPPPFQTRHFANVQGTLAPPVNYSGSTTFFDGATFRGALRTFGVINPISYFCLSRFIATEWSEIYNVYQLSGCSGARPKFPIRSTNGRAIEIASLATQRKSKRHLASSFPVILSLDINRFYGSIYTHSIPWAALGKEEAKRRYRTRTLTGHWSDTLDKLVRNCNQMQTIGIPIGPDTSRIVSELILSRIDQELTSKGSGLSSNQIHHSIDDYQIGVFSVSEAENAQAHYVRTISRYEHRLNDFKTSIDHGLGFVPSNFQRHFDVLRNQTGRDFVEHFFELLYEHIPQHSNVNVVGYALKRFAIQLARNPEKELVREYLQRLIFAAPHQARWIFPLLLGIYRVKGVTVEIRKLVLWGAEVSARRNDVGSLLWYLYVSLCLNIRLGSAICIQCTAMSNELVDLMLFHGKNLGLFSIPISQLRQRYLGSDFKSPAWLPLYEVERRRWDLSSAFTKIGSADDDGGLYAHLSANNVEFYRTDQDYFRVEAFEGWNLTQRDFEGENEHWPVFHQVDLDGNEENYV